MVTLTQVRTRLARGQFVANVYQMYHFSMSAILAEPVRQVRDHLSEVIERVEPTIITRHGREVAAVISIDDLRHYQELESRELHRLIEERRAEAEHPGYSLAEVLHETLNRDE